MRIGVNCGHTLSGTIGSGATGSLDESTQTRAVGYTLMNILRGYGYEVVDCTDDQAESVFENLREICAIANSKPLDMFISIHFNSGGGEGCEVYTYGGRDAANAGRILRQISSLGFKNRGIKDGTNLYVVRNTQAPAVLVEVCFVDTQTDAELYRRLGAERIAEAIARGISSREEGISMAQYEELKTEINDLRVEFTPVIYNYIDDNLPGFARETVQKLVDKGFLRGDETGLNLTEEMLRLLVINDRAGLYDR